MILKFIIQIVIVFLCLVLGCRHLAFACKHHDNKNYGMVGSHIMFTMLWVLIMARIILF